MYVASVPNRNSPPAILLRESFRLHGRVKNRTLANLSRWPPEKVQALRRLLKGETTLGPDLPRAFTITRSLPHGHVAAVLATIGRLGLRRLLSPRRCRERELVLAMITQRLLEPASKLATARALDPQTSHSSLGQQLELGTVRESDLYAALDWLLPQQPRLEAALAKRHLRQGALVLYDLTSTYFEGRKCPLAQYGYSRDKRRGNPQIVLGLVSNDEGCPVAVEVFEGNTADPKTVAAQVERLRERFGLQRLVLVGDRGLLTTKRIEEDLRGREGVQWITALRAPQIRQLAADGVLQMSLFDERDLAELQHDDYPRRAAGGVPQSVAGPGAGAQEGGAARHGREQARGTASGHAAGPAAVDGSREDQLPAGAGVGSLESGEVFSLADPRGRFRIRTR